LSQLLIIWHKKLAVASYTGGITQNCGELVISKIWQGKLWQILDTCIMAGGKLSIGESSFVNLLK